ncbi:MAG: hypothetical protein OXE42_01175 [Gammaproteobacteria bacterium]|nr:hypothetical protein [Gammaproteobacteria bacterium]
MSDNELSLPRQLHELALNRIVERYRLEEAPGENGGPYLSFTCQAPFAQGADAGCMRLFRGDPLFQVVTSTIVVPQIQLDSHMVFAFAPSDSAVPHFTFDSVRAGEHYAFHLDLVPRLDLGANLDYLNEAFQPLTPACEAGRAMEGLSRAELSPRQWAIMSPWMLAHRATEAAFERIDKVVLAYQDHWFSLLDKGLSAAALAQAGAGQLARRDRLNKSIIFNADVDPVWRKITPLLGEETVAEQMRILQAVSA